MAEAGSTLSDTMPSSISARASRDIDASESVRCLPRLPRELGPWTRRCRVTSSAFAVSCGPRGGGEVRVTMLIVRM